MLPRPAVAVARIQPVSGCFWRASKSFACDSLRALKRVSRSSAVLQRVTLIWTVVPPDGTTGGFDVPIAIAKAENVCMNSSSDAAGATEKRRTASAPTNAVRVFLLRIMMSPGGDFPVQTL